MNSDALAALRSESDAAEPLPAGMPAFYAQVPRIVMYDPLAELLGAAEKGRIEYRYVDAVRLAGHSCPTVAGAWLMTRAALAWLYPDQLPLRGGVRVEMSKPQDAGVTGVMASVATLVTGAAGKGGFKGLAGKYGRNGLLSFDAGMPTEMRFSRVDNGAVVEVAFDAQTVARPPALQSLMRDALSAEATDEMREAFGEAWQQWVRNILLDHADDPAVIVVLD